LASAASVAPVREKPKNRIRRLLLPLMGVVLVASCGSKSSDDAAPPPLPPSKADRAFFGVHDASLGSLQPKTGVGSLRVWDAGVQWREIETSPGHYDWTRLDQIVSAAQADHVQVTMVLAMTPPFYSQDPTKPPKDLGDYRRYATALMQRYKDYHGQRGNASYQVRNEANVVNSWTGTPQEMAQLTKIAYDVRNQVDPAAQLLGPAMAVRLPSQLKWLGTFYAQQVDGQPVSHYMDVVSLNLYPMDEYAGVPGRPEDVVHLLDQTRTALAADGVSSKLPIWNTEVNYGLKGGDPGPPHATPIPESEQAAFVVRTYLLNAAYGVGRVFWYRWDWGLLSPDIGGGTIGNTLLTDPKDFAKPTEAGRALAVVERWLTADDAQPPHCAKDSSGTYACRIDHTGGTRWVYWNPTTKGTVTVPAGMTSREGVAGVTSQVSAGSTLTVDADPVMLDSSSH
jgi:hypothetical protein